MTHNHSSESIGKSRATILAVDDETDALDVLRVLFSAEDFELAEASDAAQAIAFMRERQPDLIIVDYMMPRMSKRRSATPKRLCQCIESGVIKRSVSVLTTA